MANNQFIPDAPDISHTFVPDAPVDPRIDPLASAMPSMAPMRDETPVTFMDSGQKVTVPAWSLKGQQQFSQTPSMVPDPATAGRFDFMADTTNLRPESGDPFGLAPDQKPILNALFTRPVTDFVIDPITQIVNRLQTGAVDTANIIGRAITGHPSELGQNVMDVLPGLGLEAMHIPEPYLTPARQASITDMIKRGATTDEILSAHPNLDRTTVDLNVKAHAQGWNKNPTFKADTTDDHVNYNPDELSGKRPEVQPPVKPTVNTTHVDPISETDETGSYHPVNVRDPDTGEVTSAGRAYVDPDTGAPTGSVLAHPLTKENHTVTPETQGVIESKLPGGDAVTSPAMQGTDNRVIHNNTTFYPPEDGGNVHHFDYTKDDGSKISGYFSVNKDGDIEDVSVGNPWARPEDKQSWTLPEQRDFLKSVAAQYPDANTFSGKRVSGAREQLTDSNGDPLTTSTDLNRFRQKDIKQPGFVSTPNPDPGRPSHSFTYETPDGKVVKGSYDVEGNTIHSIDIGDKTNPVKLGVGETLNLGKQLAAAHPDVDTIEGLRISGANPDRTVKLNAQALRDRGQPATAPEPTVGTEEPQSPPVISVNNNTKQPTGTAVGPANVIHEPYEETGLSGGGNGNGNGNGGNGTGTEVGPDGEPQPAPPHMRVDDQFAGSINKDKVSDDPDLRNAYDEWARTTAAKDKDGFDELNEKTKSYLNDHNNDDHSYSLFDGPRNPRELAPWSEAVRIQTYAMAQKLSRVGFEGLTEDERNATRAMFNLADDSAYGQGSAFRARQRQIDQQGRLATGGKTGDFDNGISNKDVQEEINKLGVNNPDSVGKILAASASKDPGIVDLFRKGYISGLVSNLANHVKIYGGMIAQNGLNFISDSLAATAGQPLRLVPGAERVYATQMAARGLGYADGFVNALQKRVPGLFSDEGSGSAPLGMLKNDLMNSTFMKRPVYNTADALLSAPLNLLHSTGEFVKDIFGTSYLWDQAAKYARDRGASLADPVDLWQKMSDARNNPTPEMLAEVDKQTKIDTFRDPMGPMGRLVAGAANGIEQGIRYPTKDGSGRMITQPVPGVSAFIAPFNGIVDGVMRAGIRWGPLAPLDRYNQIGLAKGGLEGQKAAARMAVAAGLTGLLMQYIVQDGVINGSNPVNGAPANSIKIGDNYYTIKGMSAVADNALLLANARDELKATKDQDGYTGKVKAAFSSMLKTVLDESTIKDLTPFLAPLDKQGGEYKMRSYLTSIPSQLVPYNAALREETNKEVPYVTDTLDKSGAQETVNKVKAILPWEAGSLPARLDVYGRPMPSRSGPFKIQPVEQDPAIQEVNRLSTLANKKMVLPESKTYTAYDDDDVSHKVTFTPEQLRSYQEKSGDYFRRDFAQEIQSPEYQSMSDIDKIARLKEVLDAQRKNARDEVLDATAPAVSQGFVPDHQFIPDKKAR
jgi:hypothetical protein